MLPNRGWKNKIVWFLFAKLVISIHYCYSIIRGTWPRWRQHDKGLFWSLFTATQEPKYPVISACGDIKTPEGQCDVRLESYQDFLQLDCLVTNVYPRPDVSWSLKDCIGTNATGFSTCNDWTYDNVSMTYSAISKLYLHSLPLGSFSCNFICTSLGGAIQNDRESSSVQISRECCLLRNNTCTHRVCLFAYYYLFCQGNSSNSHGGIWMPSLQHSQSLSYKLCWRLWLWIAQNQEMWFSSYWQTLF